MLIQLNLLYKVEFEICIFVKDKNIHVASLLVHKITDRITVNSLELAEYIVAGIKAGSINFQRSKDLIRTKLTINYKALLKERIL